MNINKLCKHFHELLINKQLDDIKNTILDVYGIDNLVNNMNNGLNSLIFQYGIETNNTNIINMMIKYLTKNKDYLLLMNYYKKDINHTINIFKNRFENILFTLKKEELYPIINYIIDNQIYYILPYLENLFFHLDIDGIEHNNIVFTKCYLKNPEFYINKLSNLINVNKYIKLFDIDYDYIIDMGNVLHSRNGTINPFDMKYVLSRFPKSLIIICEKHLKNKQIKKILDEEKYSNYSKYITTPSYQYDDYYIILAFLKKQVNIITNDNYNDMAIDDVLFKNILQDNLVKYKYINGNIVFDEIKKYTKCIQLINNNIYIPCNTGFILIEKIDNLLV